MQKFFFSLIILFLFILAGLIAYPLLIDLDKYEKRFITEINEMTGLEAAIDGGLTVSILPKPTIKIQGFRLGNVAEASSPYLLKVASIQINIPFKRLVKGEVDIKDIILENPEVYLEQLKDGRKSWSVLREQVNTVSELPQQFHINNGTIIYRSQGKERTIEHMVADIVADRGASNYTVVGKMDVDAHTVTIEGKIAKNETSPVAELLMTSESMKLAFKGNYVESGITGALDLDILNVGQFSEAFFPNGIFTSGITSDEAVTINADVAIEDHSARLSSVTIASDVIKASGQVDVFYPKSLGDNFTWDIILEASYLDIDQLTYVEEAKNRTDEIDYYSSTFGSNNVLDYRLTVSQDFSAVLYLQAEEVIWRKKVIRNALLDADFYGGNAIIHELSAQLPGDAHLEVGGNIKHNGIRPAFSGRIKASGAMLRDIVTWLYPSMAFIPEGELQEFVLTSNIALTPRKVAFSDFRMSVDKTLLSGSLVSKPIDKIPSFKVDMRVDRFNFDRYGLTEFLDKSVRAILANAENERLDTSWLRALNSRFDISVDAKDLTYNHHKIDNVMLGGNIASGVLRLQRFIVSSNEIHMDANVLVNLLKEVPELNIYLSSKGFNSGVFLLKSPAETTEGESSPWRWSSEPFNFFGLHRFNGDIKLGFTSFLHKNMLLKGLKVSGKLDRNLFHINELSGNFYDGKFDIRGSVDISKNASLALSYGFSKIDLNKLSILLGKSLNIYGDGYLSGIVKSFGPSPEKWISELSLDADFAGRNVTLEGIDLSSIIQSSRKLFSVIDMDAVVKQAMRSGKTLFETVNGKFITDKGFISAKDFQLSSGYSRGVLLANIDPRTFNLKSVAKIAFRPENNKNVVLNFKSEGALNNLTTTLDTTQLENYITGKAVQ